MRIPFFSNLFATVREAAATPLRSSVPPRTYHAQRTTFPNAPARRSAMEASIRQRYTQFAGPLPDRGNIAPPYAMPSAGAWQGSYRVPMNYRPAVNPPMRQVPAGRTAQAPFLRNMTTAQRLRLSIENAERIKHLKELEEEDERNLQRAIAASLEEMGATSHVRTSAPVAMQRPNVAVPQRKPVFHQQFEAAKSALRNGHPTGNMCGALALAHMTGTAPQWPSLHEVAMKDLLKDVPANQLTEARLKEARKIIYDGVFIEHLQTMLTRNKVPFATLRASHPDRIDQVFRDGKTRGVTYAYVRPSGAAHFAALRKDASGQWWDMDSYHERPQRVASPDAFLKEKCADELHARGRFDLIYTSA